MPLTIYKSSAGSGKTFTLVLQYLKLVLANPNHYRQTLAVTFTNKATGEMKERIVSALVGLVNGTEKSLEEILISDFDKKINIRERAQIVLENLLHDYSSFSVTTIDAFFIRIIKAMSHEMGLPGKYDIDLNRETAIDEICAGIFAEVGRDKILTEWLETFIFDKLDAEKGWYIEGELRKIANELFKESYQQLPSKEWRISLGCISQVKAIRYSFENFIQERAKSVIKILKDCAVEPHDFSFGKQGFGNYFIKVLNNPSPLEYLPAKRFTEASFNTDNWFSKSSIKKNALSSTAADKLLNEMQSILKHVESHKEKYFTAVVVLNMVYVAGIISHMQEHLKKYRDANNLFLLSDAQLFLNKVISLSEAPFVYEKTGLRYKHFLLDEFQDTSSLQWKNLLPLVENSLADSNFVLTVGDVKQSIYRWRGADFRLLLNRLESDLKIYDEVTISKNLSFNYRSAKEIVNFNNSFFSSLIEMVERITGFGSIGEAYKNVNQEIKRQHDGKVAVKFLGDDEKETSLHIEASVKGWKRNALIKLYETIQQLVNDGYKKSEITILVNKNSDGRTIAGFLFANGFDKIISSDSLLIKNAPQVNFIINLLRIILSSSDEVSKDAAKWFYVKHLTSTVNDFAAVGETDFEKIIALLHKLRGQNLTTAIARILKFFGMNTRNDSYISALQDVVDEFLPKNTNSIYAFINWWDNARASNEKSVVVPDNEDAIRIITIHKSKGLQFPVVIMPFCNWKMQPKPDGIMWVSTQEVPFNELGGVPVKTSSLLSHTYFNEQWQTELENTFLEGLNKMYVAFTRPEEQLYIFVPDSKKEASVKSAEGCVNLIFKKDQHFSDLFRASEGVYILGKDFKKHKKSMENALGNFESPEILKAGMVSQNFDFSSIGLKILKQTEAESMQAQLGVNVHELISNFYSLGDEKQILYQIGMEDVDGRKAKLVKSALKILKQNNWHSAGYSIYCERELINDAGEILRPDRLMIKDNKVIVLDYKTGTKDKKHAQQLKQYHDVLKQLGFSEIEKYILYLESEELVSV